MSTRTQHTENFKTYFCTLVCYRWFPLFEITNFYDQVYHWFDHLKTSGCYILGYVIMPNHLHALLYPTQGSLNKLTANGKRFMAYEINNQTLMAEDIKEMKKKVTEDWQNAFPQLVKYAQNKYYKIAGSLLVGIELIKLPRVEEYRPHFVVYPLWGNKAGKDLKACLSSPIILKEFFNRKGLQFSVPYLKHDAEFSEVLKAVKKQLPFSMEGDIPLKKMFTAFDEHSKTPPLSAAPNSYLQASLMESKFEMTLCSGNEKQAQDVLNQIKKKKWDLEHFALWGIKYENWLKDMETKLSNRDQILSQLNANRQDKKLEKLHRSELN